MNIYYYLKNIILKYGDLSFCNFMKIALYSVPFGYYYSHCNYFGIGKDFITSPEITSLFGKTIANQCKQILNTMDNPILLEFGTGSGKLCIDILSRLEELNSLPNLYYIFEISTISTQYQKKLIHYNIPHLYNRIKWIKYFPKRPFNGIIIANEVLDSFPVHRFLKTRWKILESYVTLDVYKNIKEIFKPCINKKLYKYVKYFVPDYVYPYQSEVNLYIENWMKACYSILNKGIVFIIDYGFPHYEYYHEDRNMGTLVCHYKHKVHSNPFINIGKQDITAHINFTYIANVAKSIGFFISGYVNQSYFLLSNGFLNFFQNKLKNHLLEKQLAKKLLQPHEMGELFKVLAINKNMDISLDGFAMQNKKESLCEIYKFQDLCK